MVRPKSLNKSNSAVRSLGVLLSILDPRTYVHLFRVLHFINYSHAAQLSKLHRGKGVRIAPNVSFANAEHIYLGSYSRVDEYATLWAAEDGAPIEVGEHAVISPHTMVTAAKYDLERGAHDNYKYKPPQGSKIVIGKGAVIYSYCVVLAGSEIGEGALIGPGSLVNGKIPPHAIAMGTPARVVLQRQPTEATTNGQ